MQLPLISVHFMSPTRSNSLMLPLLPGHKKTQFKDVDLTSGDGGFSSSNEFRPSRSEIKKINTVILLE